MLLYMEDYSYEEIAEIFGSFIDDIMKVKIPVYEAITL